MRRFEVVRDEVWEFPAFIHETPFYWQHGWEYPESHSIYSGLHIEIDIIFDNIQGWLLRYYGDATPGYKYFRALLSALWGLNCGFPASDVLHYCIWYLRGCKVLKAYKMSEFIELLKKIERAYIDEDLIETVRQETQEYYNQLFTGLRRQSLMILDNLGLSVDVMLSYWIYSLEEYKSGPEFLDDEDKRAAFIAQVLRKLTRRELHKARTLRPIDTGALRASIHLWRHGTLPA